MTDDTLILPGEVVQDYASALYPDVSTLAGDPISHLGAHLLRAADHTYRLARGDEACPRSPWDSPVYQDSGTVVVDGALKSLEDGSTLRAFQVTLLPRDCMFGYIITDLTFSD